jgi:DNA polymerase III subunit epsilon
VSRALWCQSPLCAFDIESTGTDVFNDRIITATAVDVGDHGIGVHHAWFVNPGVPIPPEATAVHGITNELAATYFAPADVIPSIAATLEAKWAEDFAVVIMNAHFDLTLLRSEVERHSATSLRVGPVLDPLVIDRGLFPYRRGRRTLTALAEHYRVEQGKAHSSDGDALTAARVLWRQASLPQLADLTIEQMQTWQAEQHAEWAGQFEMWKRSQGANVTVNREWPVRKVA